MTAMEEEVNMVTGLLLCRLNWDTINDMFFACLSVYFSKFSGEKQQMKELV